MVKTQDVATAHDVMMNSPALRADLAERARSAMEGMNNDNWVNRENRGLEINSLIKRSGGPGDGDRFLANVAVTGSVMGLKIGSTAGEIYETLGNECVSDRRKKSLRLDYGLFEFSLYDGVCEVVAVQVHRLVIGPHDVVPSVLHAALVGLSRTVSYRDFQREVERGGDHRLEELPGQRGYRRYRVAESHVTIFVVDGSVGKGEEPAFGDIWSIMISGRG